MSSKTYKVFACVLLLTAVGLVGACSNESTDTGLRRLTSGGPDSSFFPSWSPDGNSLVYEVEPRDFSKSTSSWGVWSINSNGTSKKQLAQGNGGANMAGAPVYSPSGDKIAYWRTAGAASWAIWLMGKDGSDRRSLTQESDGVLDFPSWSPNGQQIAYTRFLKTGSMENSELWIMDADGTARVRLAANLSGRLMKSWSPDSNKIIFSSGKSLWKINADGSELTKLSQTSNIAEDFPDWSPDGARIVFQSSRVQGNDTLVALEVMSPDGNGRQVLLDNDSRKDWKGKVLEAPRWSPDGKRIAFDVGDYTNGGFDIWVLDVK